MWFCCFQYDLHKTNAKHKECKCFLFFKLQLVLILQPGLISSAALAKYLAMDQDLKFWLSELWKLCATERESSSALGEEEEELF